MNRIRWTQFETNRPRAIERRCGGNRRKLRLARFVSYLTLRFAMQRDGIRDCVEYAVRRDQGELYCRLFLETRTKPGQKRGNRLKRQLMATPAMLWFDCTSRDEGTELRRRTMEHFEVTCSARVDQAESEIARARPRVLCFDFDYPDRERLAAMKAIKHAHPSLPLIMLTVEHSEALAVWAFRVPVWNYLAKPVALPEWEENLSALAQILPSDRRNSRRIYRDEPPVPRGVPSERGNDAHFALLPALSFVDQHFNTNFSAAHVAKLCGMTRFQFSRLFHAAFGMTFKDYLLRFRVAESCRLLRQQHACVTEVACATGFNDSSYFARIFRRYVGMLPSEYVHATVRPPIASIHPASLLAGCGIVSPAAAESESEELELSEDVA